MLEKYYKLCNFYIVSLKDNINFKTTIPPKTFQIIGREKLHYLLGQMEM